MSLAEEGRLVLAHVPLTLQTPTSPSPLYLWGQWEAQWAAVGCREVLLLRLIPLVVVWIQPTDF